MLRAACIILTAPLLSVRGHNEGSAAEAADVSGGLADRLFPGADAGLIVPLRNGFWLKLVFDV